MPKKQQEENVLPEVTNESLTRKRTRIVQAKEGRVYQANTNGEGERFDTEEEKKAAKSATPAIFTVDAAKLIPPRKNRGRPSKAYLEAYAEYERNLAAYNSLLNETSDTEGAQPSEPVEKGIDEAPKEQSAPNSDIFVEKSGFVVDEDFIVLKDIEHIENPGTCECDDDDFPLEPESVQTEDVDLSIHCIGVLELEKDGSGVLRSADYNYLPSVDDVQISAQLIRQYGLCTGDVVEGEARLPMGNEKNYVLQMLEKVNGCEPRFVRDRVPFENLTPLFPDKKFDLCGNGCSSMSCRIVDLFAPIGMGQRALIVAQPKTGKTMLMKDVANAIAANYPECHLIMLLIDERPEEVTDMARTVNAEVIASTFDEPASQHVRIANIVLEKAKRMVECGHDVVIFLDSITRLARAYNTVSPASGKILSGGVEANALQKPKRFFGAARNIEGGGSLTIIATALTETGSKMDEVIFEEFKGTGNMELQLERALANKRIFPAVNVTASSTRRDDLLLDEMTQNRLWALRNYIADMNPLEAMKFLRQRLDNTKDNKEFIISINS